MGSWLGSWRRRARVRSLRARLARRYGLRLYACALSDSRTQALFAEGVVADTPDGRLDSLALHLHLYTARFALGHEAVVRVMMEAFVRDLDNALREMGTGDLSVGKKVKRLLARVYGAFEAYRGAKVEREWRQALRRNMPRCDEKRLWVHAKAVEKRLARSTLSALVRRDRGVARESRWKRQE